MRCARTTAELDITGSVIVGGVTTTATRHMKGLDVYDVLPDVIHFRSGFSAPCDLMMRDASGVETVLHDCSSASTDAASCTAMDPAVSFDGKTVAYAVYRGKLTTISENVLAQVFDAAASPTSPATSVRYPNRFLDATEAQLYLVDVASRQATPLPHLPGDFDNAPTFISASRLSFSSTRDGARGTFVPRTTSSGLSSQLWAVDRDGKNRVMLSHHELSNAEHPFTLVDGRVVYSSWQLFGSLPFRHTNGSPGGFTTLGNLFHLYVQNPDGGNSFAFYGQHSGDHALTTLLGADHKAAHFLTQTSDGRVFFADYYRGNNNGLGQIIGVMPEPEGQEGFLPTATLPSGDFYAPRDALKAATWSTSSDNMASPMSAPPL
ncbi:MAG TPA: hypothetical protein VLC93_02395, partial [Myxococcota bacterium]|nr:hypothetical protein [Myxococcota bacterium]